jgi:hypothetical protein
VDVTTGRAPEPTNEELWTQPPSAAYQVPPAPQPVHLPAIQPSAPLPAPVTMPVELAPKQNHGVLALAITSLGVGIPLTAIASAQAGLPGLVVAWIGIVCVNAVYARSRRGH